MPIDHCGIVVPPADLDKTVEFYLKALEPLGYKQMAGYPGVAVGLGDPKTDFWIGANENKVDTGRHIAFSAKDRATVKKFYDAAIAAGAKDNGEPGARPHYHDNYYGAFVYDLNGNNIEAVCHRPES